MRKWTALAAITLLGACNTPETLQNFDSEAWKNDRNGCNNQRAKLVSELDGLREEFYGKKEYVVRNVLGRPDTEELMDHSERIYIYYIEPGEQCQEQKLRELPEANRVQIRINSLGKVTEVTYYKPLETAKAS